MYSSGTDVGRMHCWLARALVLNLCVRLVAVPLPSAEPAPLPEREESHSPVEDARKLSNGAEQLGRKVTPRARRNAQGITVETEPSPQPTATSVPQPELNITAPRYILEVYRNLSRRPEPTEANTIRSLQTIEQESDCGKYVFDFDGINPEEWILFAELRLHLKPTSSVNHGNNYVVVVEELRGHREPVKILTEFISPSQSGLHEFKVTSIVSEWVASLAQHPHRHFGFQIRVYPSVGSFHSSGAPFVCEESPIKFFDSKDDLEGYDRDQEPLLAIFSYDPSTENLDLAALINGSLDLTQPNEKRSVGSELQGQRRRSKRSGDSTAPTPCHQLNPLTITAKQLQENNLVSGRIIQPTSFNARICGGYCEGLFTGTLHSALVQLLLRRGYLSNTGYRFTSCCAPVQWEALDILSERPNGAFMINRFPNVIVTKCQCVNVVAR